jgi:hypothetical protein
LCPVRRKERSVASLHERLTNEYGTHLNSEADREAAKYREVFRTTQLGAKIVPALRVAAEKAPLCVARRLLEQLNRTPRALIDAFSVTTEAEMKEQQALMFAAASWWSL